MELVKDSDPPLSLEKLKTASHKIWLAGLGAFVQLEKAGHESQRLFDHLVVEGEQLEQRLREQHEEPAQAMSEKPQPTQQNITAKKKQKKNTTNTELDLRTLMTDLSEQLTQLSSIVTEMQNSRLSPEKNKPRSTKRKTNR